MSSNTACFSSLQETYDNIPGPNKITFLLQAIRDASAAEEVCTLTYLWQGMFSSSCSSQRKGYKSLQHLSLSHSRALMSCLPLLRGQMAIKCSKFAGQLETSILCGLGVNS